MMLSESPTWQRYDLYIFSNMVDKSTMNSEVKILLRRFSSFLGVQGPNQMSLKDIKIKCDGPKLSMYKALTFHSPFISAASKSGVIRRGRTQSESFSTARNADYNPTRSNSAITKLAAKRMGKYYPKKVLSRL